jgi:hypothetical protein
MSEGRCGVRAHKSPVSLRPPQATLAVIGPRFAPNLWAPIRRADRMCARVVCFATTLVAEKHCDTSGPTPWSALIRP